MINFANTFKIAGSILGAYGAYATGKSDATQYLMQAQAADYNAAVTRFMAEQSLKASTADQIALRRNQRQFQGKQRAAVAQAGIGTGGSAADVVGQSNTLAELDAMNLAYEGAARFRAALTQADFEESAGVSYRYGASSARRTGNIGMARSLLSGASSIWGGK